MKITFKINNLLPLKERHIDFSITIEILKKLFIF